MMKLSSILKNMEMVSSLVRDGWVMAFVLSSLALLNHNLISNQTMLLLFAIVTGYMAGFAINSYYDVPFDCQDSDKAKKNFFILYPAYRNKFIYVLILPLLYWLVAFGLFGLRGYIVLIVCLFIMWGYSAKPLRLKSRPGIDLLIHSIFMQTFPYLSCLLVTNTLWRTLDVVLLVLAIFSSLTAQLEQQQRDFHVDSFTDINYTTKFGLRNSILLMRVSTLMGYSIFMIGAVTSIIPSYLLPYGLIAVPGVLHRFMREYGRPRSERLITIIQVFALCYTIFLLIWAFMGKLPPK